MNRFADLLQALASALSIILTMLGPILGLGTALNLFDVDLGGSWKIVLVTATILVAFIDFYLTRVRRDSVAKAIDVYKKLLLKSSRNISENEPTLAQTAFAAFLNHKTGQRHQATIVLSLTLAFYTTISVMLSIEISLLVITMLAGALALLQVGGAALEYRIRHALYGTTEYEARQIINFILSNADDIDLSGGLGIMQIDVDPKTEDVLQATWGVAR